MGMGEGARDLHTEARNLPSGHATPRNHLPQGATAHQLHRDVLAVSIVTDLVDRADVRVIEGSRHSRLAQQTCLRGGIRFGLRPEHLECYITAQLQIPGTVDDTHSTRPELLFNLVMGQRSVHREGPPITHLRRKGAGGRRACCRSRTIAWQVRPVCHDGSDRYGARPQTTSLATLQLRRRK